MISTTTLKHVGLGSHSPQRIIMKKKKNQKQKLKLKLVYTTEISS